MFCNWGVSSRSAEEYGNYTIASRQAPHAWHATTTAIPSWHGEAHLNLVLLDDDVARPLHWVRVCGQLLQTDLIFPRGFSRRLSHAVSLALSLHSIPLTPRNETNIRGSYFEARVISSITIFIVSKLWTMKSFRQSLLLDTCRQGHLSV